MANVKMIGHDFDKPIQIGGGARVIAMLGERLANFIRTDFRPALERWRRRRVRRNTASALRGLDDRMLRDIGIRRAGIGSVATQASNWDVEAPRAGNDNASHPSALWGRR